MDGRVGLAKPHQRPGLTVQCLLVGLDPEGQQSRHLQIKWRRQDSRLLLNATIKLQAICIGSLDRKQVLTCPSNVLVSYV